MSISDQQFFAALDKLKGVHKRLKLCKPEQVKKIEAAYGETKAASKILDAYFLEEWERRTGKPFPQRSGA